MHCPAVRNMRRFVRANSGRLTSVLKMKPLLARRNFVRMRMPWSRAASQAADALHGGAIAALADTCAAIGTIRLLPEGYTTVTSELKINFIDNIRSGAALAEARLLHCGRLTMVWEAKIYEERTRRLLAAASMTFVMLEERAKTNSHSR
ncbi:MAG: PaaI family thioesterase [Verrucomicrobia bacterium]|nr:PaaI family thioesterase [Verrucomicrobiota bacterium]